MGTVIKAVAIAKPFLTTRILALTFRAAKRCLRSAKLCIEDVGILINSGVYTENHLREPALAVLIENRLQNIFCIQFFGKDKIKNIFSFDLYNGGGGLINAIQVIDGFIQSGEIENGLIVAGDVKPLTSKNKNYNYASCAGAIILSKDAKSKGFTKFRTETFTKYLDNYQSSTSWEAGKFNFGIHSKTDFLKNCVSCAKKSIRNFFDEENLTWGEIDLVLTSNSPKEFGNKFSQACGLKNKLVQLNINREIFSAGIIFSLEKVFQNQQFQNARNILFVMVGAGITVSLSLYQN